MGFTKLTTTVNNITSQPDRPTISAAALKALIDKTGADLKTDINLLIDQLEAIPAAANLGAAQLNVSDTSDPNIQAKLAWLYEKVLQAIAGEGAVTSVNSYEPDALGNVAINADKIPVVASGFTGNLTSACTNLQLLAAAVDGLTISETATGTSATPPSGQASWTNVQAWLDGLFLFANNGKVNIATAIGSPATSSDTFSVLVGHIDTAKTNLVSAIGSPATTSDSFSTLASKISSPKDTLATNLTAKGVTAASSETLAALAGKVANINAVPAPTAASSHVVYDWNSAAISITLYVKIAGTYRVYFATSSTNPYGSQYGAGILHYGSTTVQLQIGTTTFYADITFTANQSFQVWVSSNNGSQDVLNRVMFYVANAVTYVSTTA